MFFMITELNFVKYPVDVDTMVGHSFTLRCAVRDEHQPTISWNKDNQSLGSDHVLIRKESIRIRKALSSDQGIYTCVAKNRIGIVSSRSAKVTISSGNSKSIMQLRYQIPVYTSDHQPTCGQRKKFGKAKRIIGGDNVNVTNSWPWQVLYMSTMQSQLFTITILLFIHAGVN